MPSCTGGAAFYQTRHALGPCSWHVICCVTDQLKTPVWTALSTFSDGQNNGNRPEHSEKPLPLGRSRYLYSKLYRKIRISALVAALEATKPMRNRKDFLTALKDDEAA
jgi:hypothetical protein